MRHGDHRTAVDHQPAVGVDPVALGAEAAEDVDAAAVDCGDRNAVFIGVDAVVLREDPETASVDGEVHLGVQTLVVRDDRDHAVAGALAVHVHGNVGIHRAVLLPQFFLVGRVLVDLGHVRTAHDVHAPVGGDQIGAGCRGVHIWAGRFGGCAAVALIYVQEQDRRGYAAGDLRIVQDQRDHCSRIVACFVAQVDAYLPGGECAAHAVRPGLRDVHHDGGGGLFFCVPVLGFAVPVGISAVIGILILVIYDVVGYVYRGGRIGPDGLAVQRDPVVRERQNVFRRRSVLLCRSVCLGRSIILHLGFRLCRSVLFGYGVRFRLLNCFSRAPAETQHERKRQEKGDRFFHNGIPPS